MGKRLSENISSQYIEAANRLKGKNARQRIVAYVESYDDIFFWRMILSKYETPSRYFEVMLPTRDANLERGKKSVLMNLIANSGGTNMLACVDADYDYLLQGATNVSYEVCNNPYVLHTYAYAIENLQCYAPSLHDVCVAVTLNDNHFFNFEEFLSRYSEAIFPLFVWSIWAYRNNHFKKFSLTDFNMAIDISGFNLGQPFHCLDRLYSKARQRVNLLIKQFPYAKQSYLALKAQMIKMGVTPQTCYLYIQGHHLFDKVVVPILKQVCNYLIRERENEINKTAVHDTQRRNELSSYAHSVEEIVPMLRRNMGYTSSAPYQQVLHDLENILKAGT